MSTKLLSLLVGHLGPATMGLNLRSAGLRTLIYGFFWIGFLTNDLAFMYLWKAVEITTGFKIEATEVVNLFLCKAVTVITC